MKLATKLSIFILLNSFVIIAVSTFLTYFFSRRTIQDITATQQLELSRQTLDKIDRLLYERYNGVRTISENSDILQYVLSPQQTIASSSSFLNKTLEQLALSTGPWESIDIINAHGIITGEINQTYRIGTPIQTDHTLFPLFSQALQTHTIVTSDVVLETRTKQPTLLFAAPIHNENDPARPVVGVVIGHLSWPVVLEILQDTKAHRITLFNKDGFVIGDGNPDDIPTILSQQAAKDVLGSFLATDHSQVIPTAGETNLTSYAHEKGFLDYQGHAWVLLIQTPTSTAFLPAVNTGVTIVLFLLPVIAVMCLLLLFLVIRALGPLRLIGDASRKIATGDLSKRVPVITHDEIGQLAIAFNDMTDKLQELYTGLEQKVAAGTREVKEKEKQLEAANLSLETKVQERTRALEELKSSLEKSILERTQELNNKVRDLESMNQLMVDRELKMVELKKEIADLQKK